MPIADWISLKCFLYFFEQLPVISFLNSGGSLQSGCSIINGGSSYSDMMVYLVPVLLQSSRACLTEGISDTGKGDHAGTPRCPNDMTVEKIRFMVNKCIVYLFMFIIIPILRHYLQRCFGTCQSQWLPGLTAACRSITMMCCPYTAMLGCWQSQLLVPVCIQPINNFFHHYLSFILKYI